MKWLPALIDRIREWYRGVKVPDIPPDRYSGIVVLQPDYYEQPPLAKVLGVLGRFWLNHWKWILTVIAIPLFLTLWQSLIR